MEDIKAKKSLGQNFLKDESVLNHIIDISQLTTEDVVIEIGPGQGALTEKLAGKCKKIIAIELDERMVDILHTNFVGDKSVEIIQDDILKINLPELVKRYGLQDKGYKVIANIPYYITAPIIRLLLETKYPPKEMVLMVQKEVAERIVAKKGAMSILAVSVQYYAQAKFMFTVFKESFDPRPKVDSAIIKLIYNTQLAAENQKEETKKYFRFVKTGFAAKRKTLINNISSGLQLDKKEVEEKLGLIGFNPNTRAQELGVADWKKLVDMF
jgi:16S rRNA (adenine1518-N6/adenine1519-N6)-dimethyltransferase